jgi:hypothetical protein
MLLRQGHPLGPLPRRLSSHAKILAIIIKNPAALEQITSAGPTAEHDGEVRISCLCGQQCWRT